MRSAGVFRTLRLTRYLPEYEWSIHVLTIDENAYLAGTSKSQDLLRRVPANVSIHRTVAKHPLEWINGARDWFRGVAQKPRQFAPMETVGATSADATATRSKPKRQQSLVQRMKDGITVPLMTPDRWIGWLPFAVREGKQILNRHPFDLIYSSGPPWTNHLVAHRLSQSTGNAWVADFRDPWLGNNFRPQRQGDTWVGRRHQLLEKRVIESADVVVVNTDRAFESVVDRYPDMRPGKLRVIPNGYDPADFTESNNDDSSQAVLSDRKRPMKLVHAGAFYGKRNVDSLIIAVGELIRDKQISVSDLRIDLIGAGRSNRTHESDLIKANGIEEIVKVLPAVPHEECVEQLRNADVLLLVQTDAPLCVPGKVFEYIAIGRPILTLSGEGATADLVQHEKLGPCVDPQDMEQLKSHLLDLTRQHRSARLMYSKGTAKEIYNGRSQMVLFDSAFKNAIDFASNRSMKAVTQ